MSTELSVAEAAALLGISSRAVRGLLERGSLKGRRFSGRTWAVDRKAVEERVAANAAELP
jgi:excisionase family DNA binding protein